MPVRALASVFPRDLARLVKLRLMVLTDTDLYVTDTDSSSSAAC